MIGLFYGENKLRRKITAFARNNQIKRQEIWPYTQKIVNLQRNLLVNMENKYLSAYQKQHLRECQLKQVAILDAIDVVCRKYGIDYWLDAGTLLGAVRHGGFIPWDDDIDIAMKAEDVERFVTVAPWELPANLFVQTPENEPTKEPLVKIRDLNSFFVEGGDNFNEAYEKGVYVDIFPYVVYPRVSAKFIKKVTKRIARSRAILLKPHVYSFRACAEFFWFGGQYLLNKILWRLAELIYPPSAESRTGYRVINNGCGNSHEQSTVFPLSTIEFEGRTYPAPHDIDTYLRDLFGDYMQVPPPEKRIIHSVFYMPELVDDIETL